jgi:hypothetical protein
MATVLRQLNDIAMSGVTVGIYRSRYGDCWDEYPRRGQKNVFRLTEGQELAVRDEFKTVLRGIVKAYRELGDLPDELAEEVGSES